MRAAEVLVLPVRASSGRALSPQTASRFPPVRIPTPIPCCSERDERSVSGFISVVRGRMSAFLNGLSSCKGIRFPFTVSGGCRKGKKRGRQSFHPPPAASCKAPAVPGGRIGLRMNILRSRTKPSGDLPDFVGRDRLRQPYREGGDYFSSRVRRSSRTVIPARSPSTGSTGRARTSKVLMSNWPLVLVAFQAA